MTAKLLDGKALADTLKSELRKRITTYGARPKLAVILVGEDPASQVYVAHKQEACAEIGIDSTLLHFNHISETELLTEIETLNADPSVHGILVQLPLPNDINRKKVFKSISITKDVDGFHPYHVGLLSQNQSHLTACTPYGIIQLLNAYNIGLEGVNAVIVGASELVGKPLAMALINRHATVTICHQSTKNLAEHIMQADLVITAIGCPGVIQTEWLAEHATVIDVGISRDANGQIQGDIDFKSAQKRVHAITPVPGGVGPMTVYSLLHNTLEAYLIEKGVTN